MVYSYNPIYLGVNDNDDLGDPPKTAFTKTNAMFSELMENTGRGLVSSQSSGLIFGSPVSTAGVPSFRQFNPIYDILSSNPVPVNRGGTGGITNTGAMSNLFSSSTIGTMLVRSAADAVYAVPPAVGNMLNLGLNQTISGNNLVLTLTSADGTALSSSNPGTATFMTPSTTQGVLITRVITAPVTLTVISGATLGIGVSTVDSTASAYVYLIDDNGTPRLGIAGGFPLSPGKPHSATALDGTSTNLGSLYSDAVVTSKSILYFAKLGQFAQATAGVYSLYPKCSLQKDGTVLPIGDWCETNVLVLGATSVAPTIDQSKINRFEYRYKRVGDSLQVEWMLSQLTGTYPVLSNVGTGTYLITLPGGLEFSATQPRDADSTNPGIIRKCGMPGSKGWANLTGVGSYIFECFAHSSTQWKAWSQTTGTPLSSGEVLGLSGNYGIDYLLNFTAPISGWEV